MIRLLCVLALLTPQLVGALVYSEITWAKRKYERDLRERVKSLDAYVNIAVELRVVVADPNGDDLIRGKPRLRVVHVHRAGGILDTRRREIVSYRPEQRRVWYCSEQQFPIILHREDLPLGLQVYGSEGAGKTTLLPPWFYFRWLEHIGEGREGGLVAPTNRRLRAFLKEFRAAFPGAWYTFNKSEGVITLADQTRIQLVSAHQKSKDEGSPVQSFDWSWAAGDEDQDMVERHEDIEARGRAAKVVNGVVRYKQVRPCTPKDSTKFRTHTEKLLSSGFWERRTLLGTQSPFVGAQHWERLKTTMSPREYQRRVLAMDVGPERQLYHTFRRGEAPAFDGNVRMIPLGAVDVTAEVLARWGPNLTVLCGHDPGKLYDVTEFLKAYRAPLTAEEQRLRAQHQIPLYDWYVVDEVTTEQSTTDQHVRSVVERARSKWGCNQLTWQGKASADGPRIFVRADPYSDSGATDAQPDRSIYTVWKQAGVSILPAAFKDGVKVARIPKEGRIEMSCRLLCDAQDRRRLFIACDDRRAVAAPRLLEAFETMERDEVGKAEAQRKDRHDLSHWPAAVGYALWTLEKPRFVKEAA